MAGGLQPIRPVQKQRLHSRSKVPIKILQDTLSHILRGHQENKKQEQTAFIPPWAGHSFSGRKPGQPHRDSGYLGPIADGVCLQLLITRVLLALSDTLENCDNNFNMTIKILLGQTVPLGYFVSTLTQS